jgi:galactonate dehydratase
MIVAPTAPGLGVTLTEELKAKCPFVPGTGEFVSVPGKVLGR